MTPTVSISSVQLGPRGDVVTYAYRGAGLRAALEGRPQHFDWRLERWTPDLAGDGPGKVERLATAPVSLCAKLLAASADGQLLILGGQRARASARRAPRYDAEPLGRDTVALAAAVSPDGALIVTGHPDGRLRRWTTEPCSSCPRPTRTRGRR